MSHRTCADVDVLRNRESLPQESTPSKESPTHQLAFPAETTAIEDLKVRMNFVMALCHARHEAGLTQRELAERMGLKQAYVAQIERGRKNITLSTLTHYAQACGKKVSINLR